MITVFFAYSHKDEALRNDLERHLSILKRTGVISAWHDRRIAAGDEWKETIDANLERANVILLLVSSDFLASDYCYEKEMTRALARHREKTARVIPIILRPCDWKESPLGDLQALPPDGKPVSSYPDQDQAMLDIVTGIRSAIKTVAPTPEAEPAAPPAPKPSLPPRRGVLVPGPQVLYGPRSSNLRVRREFSDQERHQFRDQTFAYIQKYFANSIAELHKRHSGLDGSVAAIDATQFSADLYRNGKQVSSCRIALHRDRSVAMEGITYSTGTSFGGGYEEQLSVADDGYTLFLKALMGSIWSQEDRDKHLSQEGAAELLWSRFIETLQHNH